jgi:hypothetical protein
MKRRFESKVANDVATIQDKRQYVRPEIEVVNLDEQPKLLSASTVQRNYGASFNGIDDEEL